MGSVVLDSSAVIALLDSTDAHHRRMLDALRDLGSHHPVVSAPGYAEVLVGASGAGPEAWRITEHVFTEGIAVVPLGADLARGAAAIRAKHPGLPLRDALIIATGEALEAEAIVTADARWASVSDRVHVI